MNLYRCISEELTHYGGEFEPPEPYAIAQVVAAGTRGRAKWIAWRSDPDSCGLGIIDMPRFSVVITRRGLALPEGIPSKVRPAWWGTPRQIRANWRQRREGVHIIYLPEGHYPGAEMTRCGKLPEGRRVVAEWGDYYEFHRRCQPCEVAQQDADVRNEERRLTS